jgi:hypothetical protein
MGPAVAMLLTFELTSTALEVRLGPPPSGHR